MCIRDRPYPGRPSRGVISAEFALDDLTTLLSYGMHLKSNFGEAPNNLSLIHI